jgi:hypothetical protein
MRVPGLICTGALSLMSLATPAFSEPKPKTNMVTDKPISAVSVEFGNVPGGVAYLNDLTGWDGHKIGELSTVNDLATFGNGLCSKYDMCTTADPACLANTACAARKKCLADHTCEGVVTRNLYIIHIVDWVADDKGRVSLSRSMWALYQSDREGNYHSIYADGDSFPNIWDVDNGVLLSVSRLRIERDASGRLIPAHANLAPPLIEYTITPTENKPLWLSGIETLISGLTGPAFDAHKASAVIPSPYLTRIRIMAISPKNLGRPFDVAIAANATGSGEGQGECDNLTVLAKCTFSNTFNVVSRDYIAFGINIVPHGPAETTYTTATDGTVSKNTSNHNAFYAVVDFTPLPKKYPMSKYPYVQGGLPVSGAATHLPYVGAAYPIPVPWLREHFSVSAFAGTVFMQQQGPAGTRDRAVKLLWGFEVPIASFTGAIKQSTGK